LGPYAGPFKVLEKKFPDTYKLKILKNFKVHPIFHVSLLKSVVRDALRPPLDPINNELEFEVQAVFK
jgi:hypothetical protein